MHLPNAQLALVADQKIRDYLLNAGNPQNSGKSALFEQFGFTRQTWPVLRAALRQHCIEHPILSTGISTHGTKHVIECALRTPDGRDPCLRSVWIIDRGADRPRFVTAY